MELNFFHVGKQHIAGCTMLLAGIPKPVFYGGIFVVVVAWFLATKWMKRQQPSQGKKKSPDLEKHSIKKANQFEAPETRLGEWKPVDFKRPKAPPYPDWDVHKTDPLPYRPFRHGPYHITMGLRTMQWDDWIELDNHFLKFHADKARRIEERGDECCRTAPEAMEGAIELLEEL